LNIPFSNLFQPSKFSIKIQADSSGPVSGLLNDIATNAISSLTGGVISGAAIFPTVSYVDVDIQRTKFSASHPVENGTFISDHNIVLPREVDVSVLCSNKDYKNLETIFQNRQNLYTITARGTVVQNCLFDSMSNVFNADALSFVPVRMKFKEVLRLPSGSGQLSFTDVSNVIDSSTSKIGEVKNQVTDIANGAVNYVTSAANGIIKKIGGFF
jgi:hypothetical protein